MAHFEKLSKLTFKLQYKDALQCFQYYQAVQVDQRKQRN